MARYSLQIKPSAGKELDALDDALFARIDLKTMALAENPRPPSCKKLKAYKDQWRIRAGDYRVASPIDDEKLLLEVTRIRHRREVYER